MPQHELFPAPPSDCPYCSAGPHNHYQHSDKCFANVAELEGSYNENRLAWRDGASLALKTGSWGRARVPITDPRDKAQEMGALCALAALREGTDATKAFAQTLKDPRWRLGRVDRGAA